MSDELHHITGNLTDKPRVVTQLEGNPLSLGVAVTRTFDPPEARFVDILVYDEAQKAKVSELKKGDAVAAVGLISKHVDNKGIDRFRMKMFRIGKVEFFYKEKKDGQPQRQRVPQSDDVVEGW